MLEVKRKPKPEWLKAKIPSGKNYFRIRRDLDERNLHTICQSARCPNIAECWENSNATFLIMGNVCTRKCLFCSVDAGVPLQLDDSEAEKILEVIDILKSKYVVITSVTRDDLEDYGCSHFAKIVCSLKQRNSDLKVEILIPDFKGDLSCLNRIAETEPHVLGHNLETVKRLYPRVGRDIKNYYVSLKVLEYSKKKSLITKSGIMVGLGESETEIKELFGNLREAGVDLLTVGQYLQPTSKNLPVEKYYTPEEFKMLKETALSFGFFAVESGPMVRSSYNAEKMYNAVLSKRGEC